MISVKNLSRLLVVGATGDVGQGIVAAALESGRQVVAVGRARGKLDSLSARHAGASLATVQGDLASEASAAALWSSAHAGFGGIDAVVIAVNAPNRQIRLAEWASEDLLALLASNLMTHFNAGKVFLPLLPGNGMLIGIGGGTADFVIPQMAHLSMAQAAQRMMYRGFARERRGGAEIRELMIVSMVNGESKREIAQPDWVTDVDIGRHICAILDAPADFPGPIMQLKSREQVGEPAPLR